MANLLTRRGFVKTGVAAVSLPVLAEHFSSSFTASDIGSEDRSIQVSSMKDGGFEDTINQYFPDLLKESQAVTLLPLLCILKNSADVAVSAFALNWSFTSSTGTTSTIDRHVVMASPTNLLTGSRPVMRPYGIRLVSPFFSWSPEGYSQQVTPRNWSHILNHNDLTNYRVSQMGSVSSVGMKVDSVIYADRKMLGKDRGKLARLYTATRNAEHDEAVSVRKCLEAKAAQPTVTQLLSAKIIGNPNDISSNIMNRYYDSRRRQAALLLNAYRTSSSTTFSHSISKLVKTPRTVISKANA